MSLSYQQSGLSLARTQQNDASLVRALQLDLRALGYLRGSIDGEFGEGTERAVRALQYDLLNNHGASRGGDGDAPVAIADFNLIGGARQVTAVTGAVDQALVGCIAALLTDARVPKLPNAADPVGENAKVARAIAQIRNGVAPSPFVLAILRQESGVRHFCVPVGANADNYIVVGFDHAVAANTDEITSRGYGVGQYTLFHHPPRAEEVADLMRDPAQNVSRAYAELREKLDKFVVGPSDRAEDRSAEHPLLPLRVCKYAPGDARYLSDCRNCALAVRKVDITPGTPCCTGSASSYHVDQYYATATYRGVPDRADFPCDWPYAVRRYNGAGQDSYHYQTRVLLNLLND
jgi:peptidoglycan hydrolase-like protein with peptidoglycan-binding domain